MTASEVAQLVLRERQGRDRGWWSQMRDCLADDATFRLSWFRGSGADFVTESKEMSRRGDVSRHRLGPPVVHERDSRAVVEMSAMIEAPAELDGIEADLMSYTRLVYQVEHRGGSWLIVSLDPVYERDTLTPSVPGTELRVDPRDLAAFRRPYRMLAYVLSERGYRVGDDLYGDDRPEPVERLYREAFDWLHGRPPSTSDQM